MTSMEDRDLGLFLGEDISSSEDLSFSPLPAGDLYFFILCLTQITFFISEKEIVDVCAHGIFRVMCIFFRASLLLFYCSRVVPER